MLLCEQGERPSNRDRPTITTCEAPRVEEEDINELPTKFAAKRSTTVGKGLVPQGKHSTIT